MSYAIPNQSDAETLKPFLLYSVVMHLVIATSLIIGVWIRTSGNAWGGVGGGESSVDVKLVSSAGIPMPRPNLPTTSDTVDPTQGLAKDEPKIPEKILDATNILKFEKEKPLPPSNKSKTFQSKTPPPPNAVPYGKGGGQMNLPTGYSQNPGAMSSGLAVQGQGGGDFATRYGWYIEAVKRAISQNWIQTTIDPGFRNSPNAHAVVNFTISRDGSIKNIHITQPSGNNSFDTSAQRALLSIDHFPRLPSDYSGSYVDVTFDFDLGMTK
jgi:TonB family protein